MYNCELEVNEETPLGSQIFSHFSGKNELVGIENKRLFGYDSRREPIYGG